MIAYTGQKLGEDDYLLKINNHKVGFLAKLTQKGQLPKAFDEWTTNYLQKTKLPVYFHSEDYAYGWELVQWRFGQSQNWAVMKHPKGFMVEIYLQQFLELLKNDTLHKGVLQGEYKWRANKLIKK